MNFKQYRKLMESEEITDRVEFAVLSALVYFADKDAAEAWPGIEKIAEKARLSFSKSGTCRSAENALKDLVARGHISIVSGGGGRRKTTTYLLHIDEKSAPREAEKEANLEAEIGEENPAFYDRNPANCAGYGNEKTPHSTTETPHSTTGIEEKPRIPRQAYKDNEDKSKRNEVVNEENDKSATSAPHDPSSQVPKIPESQQPDFKAFQQLTGWWFGTRSRDQNQQLQLSMQRLREKELPPATPENIQLFGELWKATGKSKPTPGQVVTNWEDIFNPPQQNQQVNQNGNGFSQSVTRSPHLTPLQRAEQKRDAERQQILESYRH